jgi:hypothetical protein
MYRYLIFTIAIVAGLAIGLDVISPELADAGKAWCRDCRGR